jgi:CheY-like chemotaxis protein
LTLVKSLVELHGGEARAHSAGLGQGSEFSVVLPIAARPVAAAIQESSAGGDAELDGLEGLAVLIVDDNRDAADSLGDLLLMHGATVTVAYDGLTALNAYRSFTPHVAVLDLGMPGMDGYELAERIQKEPGRRIPTLVALTGWGQPDDRARIEAAGFNLHLVKPVKLAELAGGLRDVERP